MKAFTEVVPLVFPEPGVAKNGRHFNAGGLRWYENGVAKGPITIKMWEPNEARSEFRIGKIYEVPPFDEHHIPPQEEDPFFLIWTDEDGDIWARYETVAGFEDENWAPELVEPILESVRRVKKTQNIRGWRNLITGEGDHHDGR